MRMRMHTVRMHTLQGRGSADVDYRGYGSSASAGGEQCCLIWGRLVLRTIKNDYRGHNKERMQRQASAVCRHVRSLLLASPALPKTLLQQQALSSTAGAADAAPSSGPGLASLVLYIPSLVCGWLGYWQWERKKWKV